MKQALRAVGLVLLLLPLTVQAQAACSDPYEPNDTFGTAWPISPGKLQSYICDSGDDDYFSFSATAGQRIVLRLYDLPADYGLCLYGDPVGPAIACSQNPGTTEETVEAAAPASGTHYAFVYSVQGTSDADDPYTLSLQLQDPPDLVVTDVWEQGGSLCYQVRNTGSSTADAGHYTALTVEGQTAALDLVSSDLAPGERYDGCWQYSWGCSGASDQITSCADAQGTVIESHEQNNCRGETWPCDAVPPQITDGPTVSAITPDSATVNWTTDETSDSTVRYDREAKDYGSEATKPGLTTDHSVTLTGLLPATTYHYVVESSDGAGNAATSAEAFFRTAPQADSVAPLITDLTVTRGDGPVPYYIVTATASDNVGIARVDFFLGTELVSSDYEGKLAAGAVPAAQAPREYSAYLVPGLFGMTHEQFYEKRELKVVAVDMMGTTFTWSDWFEPAYECADIRMDILYPWSSDVFYTDGDAMPAGTEIPIRVYAVHEELNCEPSPGPGWGEDPGWHCTTTTEPVRRVEFMVNMTDIGTDSTPDWRNEFSYDWPVSGYPPGRYVIRADAIVSSECKQTETVEVEIERGEPSLDVQRQVTRAGNVFQVELTVSNEGTATTEFDRIEDHVKGFQPIARDDTANHYEVTFDCTPEARECEVEIDPRTAAGAETVQLGPGEELVVQYDVVPILRSSSSAASYAFGQDPVRVVDFWGIHPQSFDRPGALTTEGDPPHAAVERAKEEADYLIVTDAQRLYALFGEEEVDDLLSAMAELAQLKQGLLGYIGSLAPLVQIERTGDGLRGSDGVADHWLSNGYLLIVGETEVVESFEITIRKEWLWWTLEERTVQTSDLFYGDTNDHIDPELRVGRVIGDDPTELIVPIQASVNVARGEPGFEFDRSHALAVSGRGDGVSSFEENVDNVSASLDDEFSVRILKQREIEDRGDSANTEFKAHDADRDVVFFRDHCGPTAWGDSTAVVSTGDFGAADPVDFEDARPFVFACCCQAGQYEDDPEDAADADNIAESFLHNGSAVYIGSTENSQRSTNNDACLWFYDHWVDTTETIGEVFRDLKVHLGGFEGDYWSLEYNLYGDPKYGGAPTGVTALSTDLRGQVLLGAATIDVHVPDYQVAVVDGQEHVTIPGGGMLYEMGKPLVPLYAHEVTYPAGTVVQEVTLLSRSAPITTTGLQLPTMTVAWDGTLVPTASAAGDEEGWWPEATYDWAADDGPDGTSVLTIQLYPFAYNEATANARFYQDYSFSVETITTSVAIERLLLDADAYAEGDNVPVELWVANAGAATDVLVDVSVWSEITGEVADGLLLETLDDLTGLASYALGWESTGFENGYYRVEAELRDTEGHLLDRASQRFRLGIVDAEVGSLVAAPATFDVGEAVALSLVVSNTGSVAISGTVVIQVQESSGAVVYTSEQAVAGLAAGNSVAVQAAWNTAAIESGSYRTVAYLRYEAAATDPVTADLRARSHLYLPVILRE